MHRFESASFVWASSLIVAVFASLAWPADRNVKPIADEGGFVRVFNGKNLSGWEGDPAAWTVQEGAIRCTGQAKQRNWLIWRGGELKDFELRLRFRYTKGNSGVQVRSKEIKQWQVRGYQVEVAPRDKMGLWHHSLSPNKQRSHLATAGQKVHIGPTGERKVQQVADPKQVQAAFRENDWNDLTVIAVGPRLVQQINGVVFAELIDEEQAFRADSGLLALQDHGHGTVVEFKDIRLKQLP